MTVTRIYATEKDLDINNLTLKLGKEKKYYATKAIHKTIYDCQDGIAFLPLTFKTMKKFFQKVTLPLSRYVNENYRKIDGSIKHLEASDYLNLNKEEPKVHEQDYYVASYFLHRQFKKEGFLDKNVKINEEKYKIKSLSFDEMIEGGIFPLFIVGECMVQPTTLENLMQKTGYKEQTINTAINALRYCGLKNLERSKDKCRYSLCNNMEKIEKFFERSKEIKEKKISRMKKYVEVIGLSEKLQNVSEISRQANLPFRTAYHWLISNEKPKINSRIANMFLNQKLLSEEEVKIFNHYGLIEPVTSTY